MKKILLTSVAVAALASSVSALEAGKMYMKADLGYNLLSSKLGDKIANGKDDASASFKNTKQGNGLNGFAGDIGFGYTLSDNIRTDITLNMSQGKKSLEDVELNKSIGDVSNAVFIDKDGKAQNSIAQGFDLKKSSVDFKEQKLGLMANVYYDFNNSSEFTPYVMSGIGAQRGSLEAKVNGFKIDNEKALPISKTVKSQDSTSFVYQIGLGLGYETSKDILFDVGYRVSGSTGKYQFKGSDLDTSSTPAGILANKGIADKDEFCTPKLQHIMTAGVRFAF